MRQMLLSSPKTEIEKLRQELKALREYVEESFTDYNDINEDTRIQLELINQTLAELQVRSKKQEKVKRPKIGFIELED